MEIKDFIPTKGSAIKGVYSTVQTHSFSSHKSNMKKNTKRNDVLNLNTVDDFNIKQAKREVIKLGMSELSNHNREAYKTQLAIKLGAKPPKQKCQNYVILKKENKKKASDSNKPILKHFGKVTLNKSNVKRRSEHLHKNKKQKTSIIESYGKVTKNK